MPGTVLSMQNIYSVKKNHANPPEGDTKPPEICLSSAQWHFKSTSNEVIWPKIISNFIHGEKSAILAIFQNGLGWPCPVRSALKNLSQELKIIFVLGADEYLERLQGKIGECLLFHVKIF